MDMKTKMTPDWIAQACRDNPAVLLDNGLIRLPPARLSFVNIFTVKKPMRADEEPKYSTNLLFPPQADLTPVGDIIMKEAQNNFGEYFQNGQYVGGLTLPFKDQGDKAKFDGYVPGAVFVTLSSKFKPAVVDTNLQPILDEKRAHAGVWAICTANTFCYRQPMKKGVSLGLNSVMIVQDDENLGGGASDPTKDFAGVNVSTSTNFNPAGQFGTAAGTGPNPGQNDEAARQAAARAALGL